MLSPIAKPYVERELMLEVSISSLFLDLEESCRKGGGIVGASGVKDTRRAHPSINKAVGGSQKTEVTVKEPAWVCSVSSAYIL